MKGFLAGLIAVFCFNRCIPPAAAQSLSLPFSCATFPADISETDLRMRFGVENLTTGPVPWGGAEGDYNEGTILFAAIPDARLEILWKDRQGKRVPDWVSIRGKQSRWRTPTGISLGTDLQTIERLNTRPFRLLGFGTDVSGTGMSWSGGAVAAETQALGGLGFVSRSRPGVGSETERRTADGLAHQTTPKHARIGVPDRP